MKCRQCGKNAKGKPANQRGVRCEFCWSPLEMELEDAGLDSDGNPVVKPKVTKPVEITNKK